ncbi:myosin phosphatase Rho-interacting protein [Lethenteron reissneri]|uniref:myosin phosphatase Rho-interacting protein n=1 Tax=Lethenteron reissneri TaxID=7753 RepID=UPI002AB7E7A6|nr:myosin phosphatase Rho-interacting protein [Lethenteron reissneri]
MLAGKEVASCLKFRANIFNKSKCQDCFRARDSHPALDEELTQAKPLYGGWLCLAPEGTDFGNSLQRSRKWQRRFFLLYEHGELRYALDAVPSTLPQGVVSMSEVVEVVEAESRTGQRNSLCISTPQRHFFVRGETREDIGGWQEVLGPYVLVNKQTLKKRNAGKSLQQEPSPPKATSGHDATDEPGATDAAFPQCRPGDHSSCPTFMQQMHHRSRTRGGLPRSASACSLSRDDVCEGRTLEGAARAGPPGGPACRLSVGDGAQAVATGNGDVKGPGQTQQRCPPQGEAAPVTKELSARFGSVLPPERRAKSLDRRTSEATMTPDLLNFKQGWLMRLDEDDKWRKHWFVLTDGSLKFYKDSMAEEALDEDGEIDLTTCHNVAPLDTQRNYGFQIHTSDGVFTLSAMTAGIRRNWVQSLSSSVRPATSRRLASIVAECGTAVPDTAATQRGGELPPPGPSWPPISTAAAAAATATAAIPLFDPTGGCRGHARQRRRDGRSRTIDLADLRSLREALRMQSRRQCRPRAKTALILPPGMAALAGPGESGPPAAPPPGVRAAPNGDPGRDPLPRTPAETPGGSGPPLPPARRGVDDDEEEGSGVGGPPDYGGGARGERRRSGAGWDGGPSAPGPGHGHDEIERRWVQVETTPLRDDKQVPIATLAGGQGPIATLAGGHGPITLAGGQGSIATLGEGQGSIATLGEGQGPIATLGEGQGPIATLGEGQGPIATLGEGQGPIATLGEGQGPIATLGEGQGPIATLGEGQGPIATLGEGQGPIATLVKGQGPIATLGEGQGPIATLGEGQGPIATLGEGQGPIATLGEGQGPIATLGEGQGPIATLGGGQGPIATLAGGQGPIATLGEVVPVDSPGLPASPPSGAPTEDFVQLLQNEVEKLRVKLEQAERELRNLRAGHGEAEAEEEVEAEEAVAWSEPLSTRPCGANSGSEIRRREGVRSPGRATRRHRRPAERRGPEDEAALAAERLRSATAEWHERAAPRGESGEESGEEGRSAGSAAPTGAETEASGPPACPSAEARRAPSAGAEEGAGEAVAAESRPRPGGGEVRRRTEVPGDAPRGRGVQSGDAEGRPGDPGGREAEDAAGAELARLVQELRRRLGEARTELRGRPSPHEVEAERLQHRADIETLKAECERGLLLMEECHRGALRELQEAQRRTVAALGEEKERLLAEETAATVAAIEAMKTAYREELEKLRKSRGGVSRSVTEERAQYEQDLASLQREIEALSEQYSHKSLQAAHLLQALEAERAALQQSRRNNRELNARNQKLGAQVAQVARGAQEERAPGEAAEGRGATRTNFELQVALRVKESEIEFLKQELRSLREELHTAQRDKKLAAHRYKDMYREMSLARAHAQRDSRLLQEKLRRLTQQQQQLASPGVDRRGHAQPPHDVLKSRSNPEGLRAGLASVGQRLKAESEGFPLGDKAQKTPV